MSLKWEKRFLGYSPTYFKKTSILLRSYCYILPEKKINFSLQNLLNWLVCDRILNSAKSCLCFAYYSNSLSIDFCLLVLTIIQHSFFLVSSIQFQMGPWFQSWLRRRSLNRKLIFSRSALAWIFWLFWVRNDWIWLVWDRSLKWVTLDFLEKKWNCHGKKTRENLMGVFIFKNN